MKIPFFITLLFLSNMVAAQEIMYQKVAIFKDGSGFYDKRLRLQSQNKEFLLTQFPQALFGTLWFYSFDNPLLGTRSFLYEKNEEKAYGNLADFLRANQGKKAILSLENQKVEGIIEQIDKDLVVVKTNNEWSGWQIKDIKNVVFLEKPNLLSQNKTQEKVLALDFKNSAKTADIGLVYLQKGISWLPNYLIDLKENNKAKIILKASVMNDAEDLVDAQLSFVVGVPNFRYRHLNEPLISSEQITDFLYQLNGNDTSSPQPRIRQTRSDFSNQIMSQSLSNYAEYDFTPEETTAPESTESKEDLFFYEKKGVNLPKNGRAFFTIFETEVDFEHIFEVELAANTSNSNVLNIDQSEKQVWHSVELKNKTAFPWTTGTAMVWQQGEDGIKPLSQDMLRYTPKSAKTNLKLTIAPDILVKDNETEVERKVGAKKIKRTNYDLLTVDASVELKNFKDKDIELTIKRTVTGLLKTTNEKWDFEKKVNYYNTLNDINQVVWKIRLKAGESKNLEYRYQVYLPQTN